MSLRPLFDNVLVKKAKSEAVTAGGLHVPESAQGKTQTGAVLAIGEGKVLNDGTVKPVKINIGDQVLFAKYAGTEVEIDGENMLVLKESEVLGIMDK